MAWTRIWIVIAALGFSPLTASASGGAVNCTAMKNGNLGPSAEQATANRVHDIFGPDSAPRSSRGEGNRAVRESSGKRK